MLRKSELDGKTTGATWLLLGSLLTVIFFPIYIAVPSLIYLTVGDSFAALVGKTFPYGRVGNKSIIGTFGQISYSGVANDFTIRNSDYIDTKFIKECDESMLLKDFINKLKNALYTE